MIDSPNEHDLIEAFPAAVVLAGPDGNIQACNSAARRLFDRDEEAIGDTIFTEGSESFSLSELVKGAIDEMGETNRTGIPDNGYTRRISLSAKPVIKNGKVLRVLCTAQPTSRRSRLDEIRRDFVANVSHELKTPITGVRLLSEAIASSLSGMETDDEALYLSRRLEMETTRLSNLVTDLLDLSKLETGHASKDQVDFAGLVREVAEPYASSAADKGLDLKINVKSDSPYVWGDAEQLELLVSNLIDNAIRYTPQGAIEIEVGSDEHSVLLIVRDSGVGIPASELPRIFERFYRVDKTRSRKGGGTGLGLSIVKHVLTNHKGRIDVRSRVGEGSEFTVKLPSYRG